MGRTAAADFLDDTSVNNFGGTYTFFGGVGPVLDAGNQPVVDPAVCLAGAFNNLPPAASNSPRSTLPPHAAVPAGRAHRRADPPDGGGASQFSLSAGTPHRPVSQFDAGLFINDDWRVRPNLTFSYGLRYETQNNISDHGRFLAARGGGVGHRRPRGQAAKTVLRAGFGIFYDRVAEKTITLTDAAVQRRHAAILPDPVPRISIPTVPTQLERASRSSCNCSTARSRRRRPTRRAWGRPADQ